MRRLQVVFYLKVCIVHDVNLFLFILLLPCLHSNLKHALPHFFLPLSSHCLLTLKTQTFHTHNLPPSYTQKKKNTPPLSNTHTRAQDFSAPTSPLSLHSLCHSIHFSSFQHSLPPSKLTRYPAMFNGLFLHPVFLF